jgi:hypothetical protein
MGRFDFKTRTGQISGILQSPFDADAQSFFARVIAAGGGLTSTEQVAINDLVLNIKGFGIWDSMKAIYPMVGASAAACAQNLKSSSFTGSFSSGWTFASSGINGNGTSAFFNTNLNQSTNLLASNNHISIYSRTNINGGAFPSGIIDAGITNNTSFSFTQLALRNSGNAAYENGSQVISVSNANSLGLYCGTSTSATSAKLYKNGSSISSSTTSQARALFNNNIYIGATNVSTTNLPLYFSSRQYAFASIGDGLTDTQASDFYTAVQAFQTSLSRQI